MRKTWLIFSQAVTVAVAVVFVLATLKPEWLQHRPTSVLSGGTSISAAQPVSLGPPGAPTPAGYRAAAKRATPAVVSVTASKAPARSPHANDPWFQFFFGERARQMQQEPQIGLGSGVIVSPQGYLLTNNHVIEGADDIEVQLTDGRRAHAKVVGTDPDTDVAVLKITLDKLPVITFGNADSLQVGDAVLAIGNPFGVGQTVTSGIVSALGRNQLGINTFENFIQTDAAINPGNSGGALIDMKGRVVGINTAIYSRSGGSVGIGFAIPSAMVRLVVDSAKAGVKTVKRPWFGARLQSLTAEVADGLGLDRPAGSVVASVVEKGPADQAGLKRSDVILSVDGVNVDDPESFGYRFATRPIGGTTMLSVLRSGKRISIPVKLIAAPETRPRDMVKLTSRSPLAGLTVGNMSPALAEELSIDTGNEGVVVSEVEEGSTAANVGFQKGDIIKALNGEQMTTSREVETILKDRRRAWEVTITRNGQTITSVFPG
jgi:Do/DeqQ family serine protease